MSAKWTIGSKIHADVRVHTYMQEDVAVGVASGEYMDPRVDSMPQDFEEQDGSEVLRSVEADVALTLQVPHHHLPPHSRVLITAGTGVFADLRVTGARRCNWH
jgi:hypothetical protein